MSEKTCGGKVVASWLIKGEYYFLRDDRDAGLCKEERYSLFRQEPYGRIGVYGGTREFTILAVPITIHKDLKARCIQ